MDKTTAIVYLSKNGLKIARQLSSFLQNTTVLDYSGNIKEIFEENWEKYDLFVCVMSVGIVVRSIKELIKQKDIDPAVVVIDEGNTHTVSLLSGHLGRANEAAILISSLLKNSPVITTGSDTTGHTAVDLWCEKNNLHPTSKQMLTTVSARLIQGGSLKLCIEMAHTGPLPADFDVVDRHQEADIIISHTKRKIDNALVLQPQNLFLGIGCNRDTPLDEFTRSFSELCDENGIEKSCFQNLASVDKKIDEKGMLQFSRNNGLKLVFFASSTLNNVDGVTVSEAALRAIGVKGVAEPSALVAAGYFNNSAELIVRKKKWKDITMAVARKTLQLQV